ncbi:MAG TPA: nuclear transport factor 2 family protein [Pyrinomonadaceae bacterium]|nr:nuclear transport factor 2 family protein [Pyrinomonadaceae bacterium]
MKIFVARNLLLILVLLVAPCVTVAAQNKAGEQTPEELRRTLAALDGALFDSFNRCDLEKFGTFFVDDLEFYHDKGGVTLTRQSLVESVKNNICGKVRREVVAESLEAHPIPGYGAVQIGVHRFYELNARPGSGPVGVAEFIHLWQHKDGAWKITRVISYDHGPAPKETSRER